MDMRRNATVGDGDGGFRHDLVALVDAIHAEPVSFECQ
jgi:hypothetical protein